jgi:hypothetical protein
LRILFFLIFLNLPNNPNQKEKNIYPTDEFFGDGGEEGPGGEDAAVHGYLSNSSPKAKDGAVQTRRARSIRPPHISTWFRSTLKTFLDKHKATYHNKKYLT